MDMNFLYFEMDYFKELYTSIHLYTGFYLYMIHTLDLTNHYICLVLRKFYSGFMFKDIYF